MKTSRILITSLTLTLLVISAAAADLSPANWPADERASLERLEDKARPEVNRVVTGKFGMVAGTMSPIANRVGIEVLRQDGTAADAATAIAMTQISRALGSFVSYAGIAQILYYEAKSGKVYSIDAGWASYLNEKEPMTIPVSEDLKGEQGRKTYVPGYMAGIEAMHQRFGVLPFKDLFVPAIWYAENGITISRSLAFFFDQREKQLSRTESGRRFMLHDLGHRPLPGDKFVQTDLAKTLRAVAQEGSRYMYTGAWGRHFVEAVRSEGGKVTMEDMERYHPTWQEPLSSSFAGHTVYGPGRSTEGGYQALEALNLIERLNIEQAAPYWTDAESFQRVSRVLNITDLPGYWMIDRARSIGINLALEDRASKSFAEALAPLVNDFFVRPARRETPSHTAGIVVVDRHGNVAAVVHSINSVLWGTTGIVVDGVPLSDPAAISREALAAASPGDRMKDLMVPMIATRDGKPTLAVAITGSLQRESVRIVLGLLGNKADLETLMTAPPLITSNGARRNEFVLPEKSYSEDFCAKLRARGSTFETVSREQAHSMRGVGVFSIIDPESGQWRSVEVTDLFAFSVGL